MANNNKIGNAENTDSKASEKQSQKPTKRSPPPDSTRERSQKFNLWFMCISGFLTALGLTLLGVVTPTATVTLFGITATLTGFILVPTLLLGVLLLIAALLYLSNTKWVSKTSWLRLPLKTLATFLAIGLFLFVLGAALGPAIGFTFVAGTGFLSVMTPIVAGFGAAVAAFAKTAIGTGVVFLV